MDTNIFVSSLSESKQHDIIELVFTRMLHDYIPVEIVNTMANVLDERICNIIDTDILTLDDIEKILK